MFEPCIFLSLCELGMLSSLHFFGMSDECNAFLSFIFLFSISDRTMFMVK